MEQAKKIDQVVQQKTSLARPIAVMIISLAGFVALGTMSGMSFFTPRVTIIVPTVYATVDGPSVTVTAKIRDLNKNAVRFFLDEKRTKNKNNCTSTTCTTTFDSTVVVDGRHWLRARLYSPAGRLLAASAKYPFFIKNKKIITITSPAQNAVISGAVDIVTRHPSSTPPELRYTFSVSSSNGSTTLGIKSCARICAYSWNTTLTANGNYTIKVIGRNNGGKVLAESAGRAVSVNNVTIPNVAVINILEPREGTTVSGATNIIVDAADPGAVNAAPAGLYNFYLDQALIGRATCAPGSRCSLAWETTRHTNGSHVLLVSATNSAGQVVARSGPRKFNISNVVTTPATVSIIEPVADSIVSGTVGIIVSYADSDTTALPSGGYTFYFDDSVMATGQCQNSANCAFQWNTVQYPSGLHTLTVTALNSNGLVLARSAPVSVTVKNNTTIIQLVIGDPLPSTVVSGLVNVRVYGVVSNASIFKVYLSDPAAKRLVAQKDCSNSSAVCEIPWDTTQSPNGGYQLSVEATTTGGTIGGAAPGQPVYISN